MLARERYSALDSFGERTRGIFLMKRVALVAGGVALVLGAGVALAGPNTGKLKIIGQVVDNVGPVDGLNAPYDLTVSPDGKSVYVSGGDENALASFRRRADGTLKFQHVLFDNQDVEHLGAPRDIVVAPDGRFVYVTSVVDGGVLVFRRNKKGRLSFLSRRAPTELLGAQGLGISPDGRHLYVSCVTGSGALVVLKRNTRTGGIKFVDIYEGDTPELGDISQPWSPVVSKDGKTVYVPASGTSAVAVLKRNRKTGRLKQIDYEKDGVNGVDGIGNTYSLAVSPDGRNVYATGVIENSVATFKRNRKSGRLKYVNVKRQSVGGVEGMQLPYGVLVSHDGKDVYVAAYGSQSVTRFKRDKRTGKLRFKQARTPTGSYFYNGPWKLAASPKTRELYVAGYVGDTVVTLKRFR